MSKFSLFSNKRKQNRYKLRVHPPNYTKEKIFPTLGKLLDETVVKPELEHIICGDLKISFFHRGKNSTR